MHMYGHVWLVPWYVLQIMKRSRSRKKRARFAYLKQWSEVLKPLRARRRKGPRSSFFARSSSSGSIDMGGSGAQRAGGHSPHIGMDMSFSVGALSAVMLSARTVAVSGAASSSSSSSTDSDSGPSVAEGVPTPADGSTAALEVMQFDMTNLALTASHVEDGDVAQTHVAGSAGHIEAAVSPGSVQVVVSVEEVIQGWNSMCVCGGTTRRMGLVWWCVNERPSLKPPPPSPPVTLVPFDLSYVHHH